VCIVVSFTRTTSCQNYDIAMLILWDQLLRFLGFLWQQLDFRNRFGEQGFDFDENKVGYLGVSRHFLLQSLNLFAHLLNAFLDARRTKFFKLA
jgi:hypothetical protein